MKILVTGGTTFVSRFTAEYFVKKGDEVFVINRNTKPQPEGVTLIEADRHELGDRLKGTHFDAVLDITAYNEHDIRAFVPALGAFDTYIMISSSAVYPETAAQPFREDDETGENRFWGRYGTDKIAAERALHELVPDAYILRPPYLCGEMDNVYREAFVFECALRGRKFYLPGDGKMKLQFFDVLDLCRVMDSIIEKRPTRRVFNVGNRDAVTVREWVTLCYAAAGKTPQFISVGREHFQRAYFPFYDYEYYLDVTAQRELINGTMPLEESMKRAFRWYVNNKDKVAVKPLFEYIDKEIENAQHN